jgi:hypothetical protein
LPPLPPSDAPDELQADAQPQLRPVLGHELGHLGRRPVQRDGQYLGTDVRPAPLGERADQQLRWVGGKAAEGPKPLHHGQHAIDLASLWCLGPYRLFNNPSILQLKDH